MIIPQGCFAFDINENNVRTDLFDIAPRDDIFAALAEKTEKFARSRDNDFFKTTGTDIEFNVAYITETGAVPTIDDFFLTEITKAHDKTSHLNYILIYAMD